MQSFRMPRIERAQIEGVQCPPKGAIGQALPRGKPMHLVVTRHPETGNPLALEVRSQRASSHKVVPLRCQPWLAAGTIVAGTIVRKNQNEWYVFHDIHQIGGRWLRESSHRERLGCLVGFMRSLDATGMGKEGWPRCSVATMLPESDGKTSFEKIGAKEIGYSVRQIQRKVLSDKGTIYVHGDDAKPRSDRGIVMMSRKDSGKSSSPELSPASITSSSSNNDFGNSSNSNGNGNGSNGKTEKTVKTVTKDNGDKRKTKTEVVVVTAGGAGPDDYQGRDKAGNRVGPVCIRSLGLSLKLNQLLRGKHYDLYRPPGSVRVLREMSLPCVWEAKNQRWRPELEGTKANTTYPVRTS